MRRGGPRPAHHIGEIEGVHNHEKTSDEMVNEIIAELDQEYPNGAVFTRAYMLDWIKGVMEVRMAEYFRPAGGVDIDNIDHNSSRRDLCGFVLDRLRASAETDKKQIYIAAVTRLLGEYEERLRMLGREADMQRNISDQTPRRHWSNLQLETGKSPKEPGGPLRIHPNEEPLGHKPLGKDGPRSMATLQTIDRFITLMAQYVKH